MKPKMSAAPTKRVSKQGSPLPIRRILAAAPIQTTQTAKRSVTRMSDTDPKRYEEDELDPNAQLEKPLNQDRGAGCAPCPQDHMPDG